MEIVIAAAVCAWITFFAVWAFLKIRKDYSQTEKDSKK